MRLAFVYPPMHVAGRPLDFANLWDDPRGTTGSEVTFLAFALEMRTRGHDVELFIEHPNAAHFDRVRLRDLADPDVAMELTDMAEGKPYDAVCVSLDVNLLRSVDPRSVRLCFQQINGFEYGKEGFDAFVDVYVSPSENHRDSLTTKSIKPWPTTHSKWHVIANGCYPEAYENGLARVPGRVVYTSSPDRGLDLLLQVWPRIRAAVPGAELRIFYYALHRWLDSWKDKQESVPPSWGPWHEFDLEHMRRAHYISKHLPELEATGGVKYVGGVSRNQLARELCEASVLAYPCETIGSASGKSYTEGFSVSTLEGCASGALPVIAACDALGDIYGHYVPMVAHPASQHLDEYADLVIKMLTDNVLADAWRSSARLLAHECSWDNLAAQLDVMLSGLVAGKRQA